MFLSLDIVMLLLRNKHTFKNYNTLKFMNLHEIRDNKRLFSAIDTSNLY